MDKDNSIKKKLRMSNNSESNNLDDIKALIASNARAIEALTESDREARKERVKLYQLMKELVKTQANLAQSHANLAQSQADLAQSHANLAQSQADVNGLLYRFMENTEEQQKQWNEQQKQWNERQKAMEEQQKQADKRQTDIVEILKILTSNQG